MIDLSQLSAARIASGAYVQELPELYSLGKVIENNPAHQKQSVFDHIVATLSHVESFLTDLSANDFSSEAHGYWEAYFGRQVTTFSELDVLRIAALAHDMAKGAVLLTDANGLTSCPGHEHVGATLSYSFADHFGASAVEKDRIYRIILHHGFAAEMLNYVVLTNQQERGWQMLTSTVGDVWPDLLVLWNADLRGSSVGQTNPDMFAKHRKQLLAWMTEKAQFLK